ncbi:MAG: hypothetical protein ACD_58C00311G0005 [uncultured bacterium]|nr:MAG: hypothetical protein ACD_58C00311G0005 [uncultured bacterium]
MVAVQSALEQYYASNVFLYPTSDCTLAISYMKSAWPIDPGKSTAYPGVTACSETAYCICAEMEGTSLVGNSAADCDYAGAKTHYCVSNLQ